MSRPTGVQRKHSRRCPAYRDREARCRGYGCGYQVQVGPRIDRRTRTFATLDDAVRWQAEMRLLFGTGQRGRTPTVRHAGEAWLRAARSGEALSNRGEPYRLRTIAGYERALRGYVFAAFGARRLDEVTRGDLKALAGRLRSEDGLTKQTVKNVLTAVGALYRYANDHGWTRANPTRALGLPGGRSSPRGRYVSALEAVALLDALEELDRALWATALFAGLRRGELMALRWDDVDLAGREILVRRSYDPTSGVMTAPKSDAGWRVVPIPEILVELLLAHRLRHAGGGRALVFARGSVAGSCRRGRESQPFSASTVARRAKAAWREHGLEPLRMHEGRHAYASMLMATGGAEDEDLQSVVGHSSVRTTKDIYGHLRDDTVDRLRRLLDAHLEAVTPSVESPEAARGVRDLEAWLAGGEREPGTSG